MMNNKNNYFANVRNIREAKGLTIKEVARDLKLNQRVLQEIETGKKGTNAKRAQSIAKYFNLPVDVLFVPIYYRAKEIHVS
ncbi:helix-turn-helix domain-containing protein [Bacillus thuringiensis]|nr:helix-turn-helix transcriptional regulator [Bacillus thuringiensis]MEB9625239.1 helix-turn-helix transcriptional regulator [Bacillus cereus]